MERGERTTTAMRAAGAPCTKVVVPIGDDVDPVVAAVAADLGHLLGVPVELLAVASAGLEAFDAEQLRAEVAIGGWDMQVRVIADDGDVPGTLLAAAGEEALVCLGTRGASALGEVLAGSVGASVVRRTPRPLVVVGPHCRPGLAGTDLVVALDGSPGGGGIVPCALGYADALGLTPRIVEVISGSEVPPAMQRAQLAQLSAVVRANSRPGAEPEPMLLYGPRVAETLAGLTDQPQVALLAMATRGVGRFQRLLSGSTALDVIRRAACPVLVGPRS